MKILWSKKNTVIKKCLLPIIFFSLLFMFLYFGTLNMASSSENENKRILTEAVNRAVVQCYAIEGMYPPSIEYLENSYGLIVDHDNYIVHYEAFASNVMPCITVISLNE